MYSRQSMKSSLRALNYFVLFFPVAYLYVQIDNACGNHHLLDTIEFKPQPPAIQPLRLNNTIAKVAAETFCHTDQGIIFRQFRNTTISARNCIGHCAHKRPESSIFRDFAIEAPRISRLCTDNPFHGFYDCIWPLVHYLTTCASLLRSNSHKTIIANNAVLSDRRFKSWVVRAQQAYLNESNSKWSILEKNRVAENQCLCFNSVVKFANDAFWRPVRYQFANDPFQDAVLYSHPTVTKRNGLVDFRQVILRSLGLNSNPHKDSYKIMVYARQDAKRRRWRNVNYFLQLLKSHLPDKVELISLRRIPRSFDEQVTIFNKANLLIAPHGAAMVNTLFMRTGSAVLEIGSRHCLPKRSGANRNSSFLDTDTIANVSDPNSWVPWHSQSLGLYHMTAPCWSLHGGARDFETENDGLLHMTFVLLMLSRSQLVDK